MPQCVSKMVKVSNLYLQRGAAKILNKALLKFGCKTNIILGYNSSNICVFVPYVLRRPLTDLRQTWWVYVGWPPICPWGVLFRKGQRINGSTGHFRFPLYYVWASLTPHAATAPFAWQAARSNSAPFAAVLHVNDVCRWTWQLLLRVLFLKCQRVDGSNGSTGHFHFHYIIYDSRRQAHATPLQKAHGVWWHQAHATPLQKAHSIFSSLDR